MWLINVKARKLVHFTDNNAVIGKYAILSHTWEEEEVSFREMDQTSTGPTHKRWLRKSISAKKGFIKIDYTCRQAEADNLDYAWMDTCCISRDSSAELSEAINAMFRWYRNAKLCYVYFPDAGDDLKNAKRFWDSELTSNPTPFVEAVKALRKCRWFKRGWTLQELLAPSELRFFCNDWTPIGSRYELGRTLAQVTKISLTAFDDPRAIFGLTVAERMAWAANRSTTREEDAAYCLLGIFNVNMPLLYGEGASKAFLRLQQEIMGASWDQIDLRLVDEGAFSS